jgi:hypothetical protein
LLIPPKLVLSFKPGITLKRQIQENPAQESWMKR